MKHSNKRFLSALLLVCMILSMNCAFASAAYIPPDDSQSSDYISSYTAWVNNDGGGEISCTVYVTGVVNATMIGAQDIYFYESTSEHGTYSYVDHYNYATNPDMMGTGMIYQDSPVSYENAVANRWYMAVVTIYVGDSTGHDTRTIYTDPVKAT